MSSIIKELPNTGFAPSNESIAKHLREQADWIADEDTKPVRNVFLVIEYEDGSLMRQTCGKTCDLARAIGVLTVATTRAALGE